MSNLCQDCKISCCRNFSITTELIDPVRHAQNLQNFSFIHKTGKKLVRVYGHETIVGVYNCDRFQSTGECQDYEILPRPDFCKRTGVVDISHKNCLLKV